jgi:hypothetical protein
MFKVKVLAPLVSAAVALGALGMPAPTASAVVSTTIEGAVVVLDLPHVSVSDSEDDHPRYYDWAYEDWNDGYRLPPPGRGQYIAGFGGNNLTAKVTSNGGCVIKDGSGEVWCFGREHLDGDGTRRNIPVPRRLAGLSADELQYIAVPSSWRTWKLTESAGTEWVSDGNLRAMCALDTSGTVKCWGVNGDELLLGPTAVRSGIQKLYQGGALSEDGELLTWEWVHEDDVNQLELRRVGTIPESIELDSLEVLTGRWGWQSDHLASYVSEEVDLDEQTYKYSAEFASIGGQLYRLDGWRANPIGTVLPDDLIGIGALDWGFGPDDVAIEDKYSPTFDVTLREMDVMGTPVADSERDCVRDADLLRCVREDDWDWLSESINGTIVGGEGERSWNYSMYRGYNLPEYWDRYEIPADSVDVVEGRGWACVIRGATSGVDCAPVSQYVRPVAVDDYWTYQTDVFVRRDRNLDGLLSLGTEMPINCGVGFQCDFEAESLSQDGSYVTAIGTLTRTPRTSVTISGSVEFDDETAVSGGSVSWESSDGLLRSSAEISSSGTFTLAARSGDGTISVSVTPYQYVGCPPLDGTIVSAVTQPACLTAISSASISVALSTSLANRHIVLPTVPGEARTIDLRFGDGETPMAGVSLRGSATGSCTLTDVDGLGGLYACADYQLNSDYYGDGSFVVQTGGDGTATIWAPTEVDVALTASMTESDGITWSDTLDSFYDDGPTPAPYLFPGLIVAATPEAMSVRRGEEATVESFVRVDGIDPAFGLSAVLEPVDGQSTTCAATGDLTDTSDENGEVAFGTCPNVTGDWRVVSSDGSFFPSAPFEITVTSPPMVSSISVRGGVLDEAFDPDESEFTGYFTGTSVRFTVVKDASARRARVTVSSCRRPRAGSVDCSVSVRMDGVTDVYTFTFRRVP